MVSQQLILTERDTVTQFFIFPCLIQFTLAASLLIGLSCVKLSGCFTYRQHTVSWNNGTMDWITPDFSCKGRETKESHLLAEFFTSLPSISLFCLVSLHFHWSHANDCAATQPRGNCIRETSELTVCVCVVEVARGWQASRLSLLAPSPTLSFSFSLCGDLGSDPPSISFKTHMSFQMPVFHHLSRLIAVSEKSLRHFGS